ncbi:MAG TPA: GNAT family protein [Xanthobacteraceae bacterium]|jgi:RimJ/RimL family protein N-acetyltransferase|nr:GNAT family protein [Xanthobacteraceae bacterium]
MFIGTNIVVGALVPDDYAAMYCWANDIVAARLDGAFRPANLHDVVGQCQAAGSDPSRVLLAIRLRNDPKIIGYVHIQHISAAHRSADIGMRIGEEKYRGLGYGREALHIATEFCWNHLNLERLGLIVFNHNIRAIKAYRAAGFKKEGLLKRLFFVDGQWVDVMVMASFRRTKKQRMPIEKDSSPTLAIGTAAAA